MGEHGHHLKEAFFHYSIGIYLSAWLLFMQNSWRDILDFIHSDVANSLEMQEPLPADTVLKFINLMKFYP
jgi:hypothetical protein